MTINTIWEGGLCSDTQNVFLGYVSGGKFVDLKNWKFIGLMIVCQVTITQWESWRFDVIHICFVWC